jgi:hypothetical protein
MVAVAIVFSFQNQKTLSKNCVKNPDCTLWRIPSAFPQAVDIYAIADR